MEGNEIFELGEQLSFMSRPQNGRQLERRTVEVLENGKTRECFR